MDLPEEKMSEALEGQIRQKSSSKRTLGKHLRQDATSSLSGDTSGAAREKKLASILRKLYTGRKLQGGGGGGGGVGGGGHWTVFNNAGDRYKRREHWHQVKKGGH